MGCAGASGARERVLDRRQAERAGRREPPAAHDLSPTLLVTCGHDMLRDVGHAHAPKLAAAGNDLTNPHHPDLPHGFIQMTAHSRRCLEATEELARLIGKACAHPDGIPARRFGLSRAVGFAFTHRMTSRSRAHGAAAFRCRTTCPSSWDMPRKTAPAKAQPDTPLSCVLCGRPIPPGAKSSLHHLTPRLKGGTHLGTVRLHQICHSAIHARYTEAEIARHLAAPELLRNDPELDRFVSWVRTKPDDFHAPTRRARARTAKWK